MEERILTLHPENKSGVSIRRDKYEAIRNAIQLALDAATELTYTELTESVVEQLEGRFEGSIPWYVTTVKLDMEARGLIERVQRSSPQVLRRVGDDV